jgi:hypothetical protein
MTNITRLQDARVFKKKGWPLNMPVEERTFSKEYSNHWFDLMNAYGRFMIATREYSDGTRAGSLGQWRRVKRRLADLHKEMAKCNGFVGKLLKGKSEQDKEECALLSFFPTERAIPFVEYWNSVIVAVDSGTPLTIKPGDSPRWTDEENSP